MSKQLITLVNQLMVL